MAALNGAQKRARSHLAIHERGRIRLVPVKDVIYFKAELKYITVHTEQHDYLLEESLTHLEQEFGERFLRIHRNCLVAREAIAGFERGQSNDDVGWLVVLKNETEKLAVSRRQAHSVKEIRHEKVRGVLSGKKRCSAKMSLNRLPASISEGDEKLAITDGTTWNSGKSQIFGWL